MLLLIDELHESGRFAEPALRLVRDAARADAGRGTRGMPDKETASDASVASCASSTVRPASSRARRTRQTRARMALGARRARRRRALALRQAIDQAGAVYLAERLHAARIALKKLRYGLELASRRAA